ncbi:TetR family transcriptional regulator C-terminal domain-containing protein [Streptomyces sp. ME03-5709C]|nr:TetR family transcriptional regulator C-terminal domain-containing protein [Streptomyces sp. ME03-5709C]
MRDAITLRVAELLERQQRHLEHLDSFRGLERWRDGLIEGNALLTGAHGCPQEPLASKLPDRNEEARKAITRHFSAWQRLLEGGLTRMKDTGVLRPEADVKTLATGIMAALQGGYLLAQTARDINPVKIALDMAFAHVRTYAAASRDRNPEAGTDTG